MGHLTGELLVLKQVWNSLLSILLLAHWLALLFDLPRTSSELLCNRDAALALCETLNNRSYRHFRCVLWVSALKREIRILIYI